MFGSSRLINILGPNTVYPEAFVVGDAVGTSSDVARFGSRSYKAWNGTSNSTTSIKLTPSPAVNYVVPLATEQRVDEFTAEFWYYITVAPTVTRSMWFRRGVGTEWRFLMQANRIPQLRYRYFNPYPGTLSERGISGTSANGIALNTWHHLAFTTEQNTVRFFQNGVRVQERTEAEGFREFGVGADRGWAIGEGAQSSMRYYIDDLRVSDVCRYKQTFTLPTQPHSYDNRTIVLLNFEETEGSTSFKTTYD